MKKITHVSQRLALALVSVLGLFSMTIDSQAQDIHQFTFHVSAGVSPLVGDISKRLDNGWHITVGGGYKFTPHFDTTLDYTFNGFGVSRGVLNEAQVPDGDAHVWSITVNPKLRLNPSGKVDPYIVGGVGYYRRTVHFTKPALVDVFIFDPFFWCVLQHSGPSESSNR